MARQKRKFSGTLLFTILVVALGAYIFFFEIKKGERDEQKKSADAKVFAGLELAKVHSLSISPNAMDEEKVISLQKEGATWQLLKPVRDAADSDAVETFIKSLLDEKVQESLGDQAGDLKTYGLDHPKGSLALTPTDGPTVLVNIGSIKAYDGSFYATIMGRTGVYLLSSVWGAYIDKKPNDFRLKRLERARFRDWTHVTTKVAGKKNLELKKVDERWESVPKSDIPLQLNLVEGFVFQMANLEVLDFVDETKTNLAQHGLASPNYEINLSGEKDKKPHDFKLLLSSKSPDGSKQSASATSSEVNGVVKVYASILDVAGRSVNYFFDRKFPFQYDPTQASRVKIKTRDGSGELHAAKAEELTRALSRMEAHTYLTEKGKGLQPAKNQIEVFNEKGVLLTRVAWGDEYKPKDADPADANIKFFYAQTSKVPQYTLAIKQSQIEELGLAKLFKEQTKPHASPSAKESKP